MNISSYSLKLTGKAEIPKALSIDSNYQLTLQGTIISSSDHSNQDGTASRVYVFKPVLISLIDERGETIKVKDMRKMSQKLRGLLFREWQESGEKIDADEFYEREMGSIISERMNKN